MGRSELECDCEIIHNEAVEEVKRGLEDDQVLQAVSDFFKALCDKTRMKIVQALEIHELCVCDISVLLNMTKSAISHQLKYLRDLNIVKSKKVGKEVFYSLSDEHVQEIVEVAKRHIKEETSE